MGGAAVVVAKQFLGGEPVFEIAARRAAALNPKEVGGVLDFGLGGFGKEIDFCLHDSLQY